MTPPTPDTPLALESTSAKDRALRRRLARAKLEELTRAHHTGISQTVRELIDAV
ncbi:hypothetical protein [Galactobacter sp.]|uniref:hypothetical protein n=1 Tax=Galactobacter sp. TaxID=2676125 RepID=UPI0025BB56D7|nr:hypothetical protein [Galactobacter sp.]